MGRQKVKAPSKPTPHLDAWFENLESFLRAEPGRIAALGRHLFGDTALAKVKVSEWLARRNNPNGEHVLAINAWVENQQKISQRPKRSKK